MRYICDRCGNELITQEEIDRGICDDCEEELMDAEAILYTPGFGVDLNDLA